MRWLWIILLCSGSACLGQSVSVSGIVVSDDSRRVLSGASVEIIKPRFAAQTDEDGRFELGTMKIGRYELVIRYVGYLAYKQIINVQSDTTLRIRLIAFATDLDEVIVTSQSPSQTNEPIISTTTLTQKQLRNVPSIGSEHDIARTLTLTPGIKADNAGSAGLYVRGGSADQNLFLVQHVPLYKNSHFFGFLSPFNSDVIQQVDLYKGGFPARFGGRLSSVLDVTIKPADMRQTRVLGTVGILSSRLLVETPIVKDRVSLLLAGRRSYFDLFTRIFQGTGTTSGPNYYFYDFTGMLTARLGSHTSFQLFAYQDTDRLQAGAQNDLEDLRYDQRWRSFILGLSATSQLTKHVSNTFEVNTSNYTLAQATSQTQQSISTLYEFSNAIRTKTARNTIEWKPIALYLLRVGGVYADYRFQPGNLVFTGQGTRGNHSLDSTSTTEISGFLENEFSGKRIGANAGLRFATYRVINQTNYQFIEPRLLLHYKLTPISSIKAAYSRMNQPIHLLTNPGFGIPVDLWFPTKGQIRPQLSDQVSVAYNRDIVLGPTNQLEVSIEGYYKKMNNIIAYRDGHSSQDFTMLSQEAVRSWEAVVAIGQGTAYGAELFLQKKQGRLTGWLGYTLSWTINQFDELNMGKPFAARQDRRHDVSIVGIYQLSKRWSINGTWIYQTGQPVTLPQAVYGQVNIDFFTNRLGPYSGVLFTYGERNSYRMKATHRLDISIQRKTTHKWGVGQLELSVYNVYNRKNPYYYYLSLGNKVKSVSLFQFIPSLSYTFNIYTREKNKM